MRSSIINGIREVVYEMTDRNADGSMTIRTTPMIGGRLEKKNLSEERLQFLGNFTYLIINTGFISEKTRRYIVDKFCSYKTLAQKMTEETGKTVNANTLQSIVWADKNKIERYFSDKILLDVIEYTDVDIAESRKTLNILIDRYGKASLLEKNLIIKLPECEMANKQFSDSEFDENFHLLTPYIKSQAEFIGSTMSTEFIGYLKYLLNNNDITSLSEQDKKRKVFLEHLLQ